MTAEIRYDISESEYHSLKLMSATQLKTAATDSLAAVKAYLDGGIKDSKALRIGSYCHLAVNSPDDWAKYVREPASLSEGIKNADGTLSRKPRATKAYKENLAKWIEDNPDKVLVPADEMDLVEECRDALFQSECYKQPNATEITVLFDLFGEPAKARIDAERLNEDGSYDIYDWKFMEGTANFQDKIFRYGYHIQMAVYRWAYCAAGRTVNKVHIVGIDKETRTPGYIACAPEGMSEESLALGLVEARHWLGQIRNCRLTGVWPGPPEPPKQVKCPKSWGVPRWHKSPVIDSGAAVLSF